MTLTTCLIEDRHTELPAHCDNCDWRGLAGDANYEIANLDRRIEPGRTVPIAECPDCGALVYLDT
jgi:predicted RNA-binding Zn-ribbon protein involved in translation (DUF1610 family)